MLDYRVLPDTVTCSARDRRSVAALTVVVTNSGDVPVECPLLRLLVPSAPVEKPSILTTDPGTITALAGDRTPWAVGADGDGLLFAVPLPPVTGIAAGESVELLLGEVVVSSLEGTASIVVITPGGTTYRLPVRKEPSSRKDSRCSSPHPN